MARTNVFEQYREVVNEQLDAQGVKGIPRVMANVQISGLQTGNFITKAVYKITGLFQHTSLVGAGVGAYQISRSTFSRSPEESIGIGLMTFVTSEVLSRINNNDVIIIGRSLIDAGFTGVAVNALLKRFGNPESTKLGFLAAGVSGLITEGARLIRHGLKNWSEGRLKADSEEMIEAR